MCTDTTAGMMRALLLSGSVMSTDFSARIPVTVLTGFLGAGKTTLLNNLLHQNHGYRIAIIENEFADTGIDNELLVQSKDEQIIEMVNGCICCTVRGDLIRILDNLATRREAGTLQFDYVVIETTGVADPGPVAQTFFMNNEVTRRYRLDGVITLVDALHAQKQLDAHLVAQAQVGFADRLLLTKTDLVSADALALLEQRLVRMNPRAPMQRVTNGNLSAEQVLGLKGFSLMTDLQIDPRAVSTTATGNLLRATPSASTAHVHDDHIGSMVFQTDRPIDQERFEAFIGGIVHRLAMDLLRYKGVLHFQGINNRVVFQGVHDQIGATDGRDWEAGESRTSTIVFIGRNLPTELLRDGLEHCLV